MKSVLSYLGGKSRLASQIVTQIPMDHTCYVEPFCGACWVLFAKEPGKVEVINDKDSELTCFWRVVQNHLIPFLDLFKNAVTSRQIFEWEKEKRPETLTDLQRAVRYFYLQKNAFAGKTTGRTFGTATTKNPGINFNSLEDDLLQIHWRMQNVMIEHLDALDCIRRYDRPKTFFYIDPPYYDTTGYAVPFGHQDYLNLAEVLSSIKGRFLLSLNDHPEVRKIFSDFKFKSVKLKYSAGNSRTASKTRSVDRSEVLIRNY